MERQHFCIFLIFGTILRSCLGAGNVKTWADCSEDLAHDIIDCSNLGFRHIPLEVFSTKFKNIKLGRNPLLCDCNVASFIELLQKHRHRFLDVEEIECAEPSKLQGRKIVELGKDEVCSRAKRATGWRKQCKLQKFDGIPSVNCINKGMKEPPRDIFTVPMKYNIYIGINPYVCGCNLLWFFKKLQTHPLRDKIVDLTWSECMKPERLKPYHFLELTPEMVCPEAFPCLKKPCAKDTEKCVAKKKSYICEDVDECAIPFACPGTAVCNNTSPLFQCHCIKGYRTVGERFETECSDIDECSDGQHGCHDNATCTNSFGGYECSCKTGFDDITGNGTVCVKKKKKSACVLSRATCPKNAECVDYKESFRCRCKQGFRPRRGRCVKKILKKLVEKGKDKNEDLTGIHNSTESGNTAAVAVIVGGSTAGVCSLLVAVALIVFFWKRNQTDEADECSESEEEHCYVYLP